MYRVTGDPNKIRVQLRIKTVGSKRDRDGDAVQSAGHSNSEPKRDFIILDKTDTISKMQDEVSLAKGWTRGLPRPRLIFTLLACRLKRSLACLDTTNVFTTWVQNSKIVKRR